MLRVHRSDFEQGGALERSKTESEDGDSSCKKRKLSSKSAFPFVYDSYTSVRGEPKMFELTCRRCHQWIMDYQKDGPGSLIRCYVDRIYHPAALRRLTFTRETIHNVPAIKCDRCKAILAYPIIYQRKKPYPEVRSAYILIKDKGLCRVEYRER